MNPLRKFTRLLPTTLILIAVLASGGLPWRGHSGVIAMSPASRLDPETPDATPSPIPFPAAEAMPPAIQRLLNEAARHAGIPAEQLQVGHYERVTLPLTGVSFDYAKVLDRSTGEAYAIALDDGGVIVNADALRAAETAAFRATYGKLHPSLARRLQAAAPREMISVSIWLDMGGRDAAIPRVSPEQARVIGPEMIRQMEADGLARAAQMHRQAQQPLLEVLPTLGGRILSAPDTAPIVFAELPAESIQKLSELPYVDAIDLVVEGGPEQAGIDQEKSIGGPELSLARRVHKADLVAARGITGAGVKVAVIEGDSIEFANPYLSGACGPNASCPDKDDHATAVGGIIASSHSTVRGMAYGVGSNLLSSNGGGWTLAHHQLATTWAITQEASALNHSYFTEADGVTHNSDRWLDYIVRNYAKFIVKSAGNRGESDGYITSPGRGYNVLTVGVVEDKGTLTWDDDTMAEISSWVYSSGNEYKPEVVATGCAEWITGIGASPGITSTGTSIPWIYDQGCGTSYAAPVATGGGALLMQRDPALKEWPEAVKAILIATALQNIEGNSRRSEKDGAGAVDLAAADTLVANGWWRGHVLSGASFVNQYFTSTTIYLYAGERVRVALAYDSNPSSDYTTNPLEGDLDLRLFDPGGTLVASSSGTHSWEIIDHTTTVAGNYTVRIYNVGNSLAGSETTYAGVAVWPGHYVLSPYVDQTRDTPPGGYHRASGDHYRFTRSAFWNAVGLWSPAGGDYDIFLLNNSVFTDPADLALLEDSTTGVSPDIVVVDGSHAPAGNYYATVSAYGGSGDYRIQHAVWSDNLSSDGIYGPYTASGQSLRVWDIFFYTGQRRCVFVIPTGSGTADLGILLFDSDPSVASTWYQGRSQAVVSRDSAGAGGIEGLVYTSPDADWKGLVVYNKSSGTSTYNIRVRSGNCAAYVPITRK